ncbi:phospho-N-acetylmuramoyl-pentapeptide-transferase [Alphaproteobacteria bacterium]|nr:phospho-N-acetylmuramoyl-pentapeptide-transferase [Alphaproteobacteria bacterium]
MLFNLLSPLADEFVFFNLFKFLTFRAGGAIITAMILSFILGPIIIKWLKSKQGEGQPIRNDGPATHIINKAGTPTMGGILILVSFGVSTLLWANLTNQFIWITLFVTLGFGFIGFIDDYLKVTKKNHIGVKGNIKLFFEIIIALIAGYWITTLTSSPLSFGLAVPFFKDFLINLGWFYIPMIILVIVGSSNAVNLTDGLDGLAIVPVIIAASSYALISYLVGHAVFSSYLNIHGIPGTGELAIFCGALVGAGLGFLWFNAPPASVFMGDTGSLSMGSALGVVSVATKHELVLLIIGGLFVLETVSVMVQVVSYKLTGKRVFRMAPLHHHYEQKGWPEATIVIRFWIIAVILALIGLATLKLR